MPSLTAVDQYNRASLRVVVAQICQSLGWQSASASALDVMVDVLRNQLLEIGKLTGRYANQFDRTLANLDDLGLALRDLGVPVSELEEYVSSVESPAFPRAVPQLPVPRPTNLSFLKPGSQEIVTRPIHVYEHLPPMHPDTADEEMTDSQSADLSGGGGVTRSLSGSVQSPGLKRPSDSFNSENKRRSFLPEEEGRPMREILSVMMTTSGFISPAREGKLAETRLPEPLDDYGDDYRHVKTRKQRADTYRRLSERENERRNRDRDRWLREDDLFDIIDVKVEEEGEASGGASPEKLPTAAESPAKLKPFKKHVKSEPKERKADLPASVSPRGRPEADKPVVKKKKLKPPDGKSSKLSIFKKKIAKKLDKPAEKTAAASSAAAAAAAIKKKSKKIPSTSRSHTGSGHKPNKAPKPSSDRPAPKASDHSPAKSAEPAAKAEKKSADQPSKADPAAPRPAEKGAEKTPPRSGERARPRSPSPPPASLTPPGTPATPRPPAEARRKPSEASLGELSPRSDDSGTPDRPRTPELPSSRRSPSPPPPPPPDPAALLNNPLIPRFPFPFGGAEAGVPAPPFPGLRPPPSLFLNPAAPGGGGGPSPERRRDKARPLAARALDPRRSPSDASDLSRSPTPDMTAMTPLKRLELAERAEKRKEREHKKNKKDKKDKKKKDKKDREKKDLKSEKKEKKKKDEKDKAPPKTSEARDEGVPKLTLRLGSRDSSPNRSPTPDSTATPKLVIKPVRDQPEPPAPTTSSVGRPKKKPDKKAKAEEATPARLKPPKKEKEKKKSPVAKAKKTVSPPKTQPTAVIAETVGSYLDSEGNRIWICPKCGRQDDGSPMIGCDGCDDWYHWVCVGIQVPPDKNEDWFCPRCIAKMQSSVKKGKGRGKKK